MADGIWAGVFGVAGVVVGASITQVADSIRWARERQERKLERRQTVLIRLQQCASDACVHAGPLADAVRAVHEGTVEQGTVNFVPLQDALRVLNQSIDELQAIGPPELTEPARDLLLCGAELHDAASRGAPSDETMALLHAVSDAKVLVVNAARSAGVIEN